MRLCGYKKYDFVLLNSPRKLHAASYIPTEANPNIDGIWPYARSWDFKR